MNARAFLQSSSASPVRPLPAFMHVCRLCTDKLVCKSCKTVVGFLTTDGEASHQCEKTDQSQRSQETLHTPMPRTPHEQSCCEPASRAQGKIKEFCFFKHRICVPLRDTDAQEADAFSHYTDVSLLAGNMESLCRKTGVHRFFIERLQPSKSEEAKNKVKASMENDEPTALALKVAVRECCFLLVQGKTDSSPVRTEDEVVGQAARTATLRAMKVSSGSALSRRTETGGWKPACAKPCMLLFAGSS